MDLILKRIKLNGMIGQFLKTVLLHKMCIGMLREVMTSIIKPSIDNKPYVQVEADGWGYYTLHAQLKQMSNS